MRYDKPFMIRLSEQEHAMLDDLLRREDKIVSKAELVRRLIQRAHDGQNDSASSLLRDAYWLLAGFMGTARSSREVDKLRDRIRAYAGDVEEEVSR
jgi:RNA polymerase-interacting CarD/CdnL/TRCF family regulator